MHSLKRFTPACLAASLAALIAASASAQTETQERAPRAGAQGAQEAQASNVDLYFPTGEQSSSLLMIRAQAPDEVRVGQPFEYQLTVRNLTDNVTLEDVRINHDSSGYVSVEDAQVGDQAEEQQGQQPQAGQGQQGQQADRPQQGEGQADQDQQRQAQANQDQQGEGQANQDQQRQAQQRQQGQQQGQQQAQQQHDHGQHGQQARGGQGMGMGQGHDGNAVVIGELKPGQTETVRIRAVAEREGTAGVCFRVAYTPTVCLVTRFVEPEIQLTKAAPEVADICQPLRFQYSVRNTGSADVANVVVTDELPEGLVLANGERMLSHDVGDLPAGASREFTADVRATRTGEFGSRAVARSADDVQAQSQRPATRIVAAELQAEIQGPEVQYTNQPSTYRVTVRNTGDGPAIDTVLDVNVDERTRLVRTSKTSNEGVAPEQADNRTLRWNVGRLEPGEETAVSFTVNLSQVPQGYRAQADPAQAERRQGDEQSGQAEAMNLRHVAEATSLCAADEQPEEVRQRATAQAVAQAEILALPALLLSLVDRNDQVPQGENVEYVVTVVNQGSGPDSDVSIVVTLPEGLEYVDSQGPSEAQPNGQTVNFQPVENLAPGEELRWEVTARANASGQVSTRADLDSAFLSTTAVSVEPTTILGEGANATTRSQDRQAQPLEGQDQPRPGQPGQPGQPRPNTPE